MGGVGLEEREAEAFGKGFEKCEISSFNHLPTMVKFHSFWTSHVMFFLDIWVT